MSAAYSVKVLNPHEIGPEGVQQVVETMEAQGYILSHTMEGSPQGSFDADTSSIDGSFTLYYFRTKKPKKGVQYVNGNGTNIVEIRRRFNFYYFDWGLPENIARELAINGISRCNLGKSFPNKNKMKVILGPACGEHLEAVFTAMRRVYEETEV